MLNWIIRVVRGSLRCLLRRAIAAKVEAAPPTPYDTQGTEWPGETKSSTEVPRDQVLEEDSALEQISSLDTENTTDPALDPDPISTGTGLLNPPVSAPVNPSVSMDEIGAKEPASQAPREIPGRRIGPTQPSRPEVSERSGRTEPLSPSSKPVLICRESPSSQMWEMVLSANEVTGIVAVTQNGVQLKEIKRGVATFHIPQVVCPLNLKMELLRMFHCSTKVH